MGFVMMYGFLAALLVIMTKPLWSVPGALLWGASRRLLWLLLALLLFALSIAQSGPLVQAFRT